MTRPHSEFQDWLRWRAGLSPSSIAIKFRGIAFTYQELHDRASRLAAGLHSVGVRKGARVCLLMRPSDSYVAMVHAIGRVGAVVVPLNTRLSGRELASQIRDCSASLLVRDETPEDIKDAADGSPRSGSRWADPTSLVRAAGGATISGGSRRATEIHSIVYTSGSTGKPKGVQITVSNVFWSVVSFGLQNGTDGSDRWLLVLPLFHVGGYAILFRSLLAGSSIVIHPRFDEEDVSKAIEAEGITLTSMVPTMVSRLLSVRRKPLPGTLRSLFVGGAQTSASLLREMRRMRVPAVLTYGMTETFSQVAVCRIGTAPGTGDGSFRPMLFTSAAIKSGRVFSASPGQVGEICLRGPTIFKGYWRRQRWSAAVFSGAWFRTGDLGKLTRSGDIEILGRIDDMVITGGENVHPAEVEAAIREHESVEDAVVVGIADERWGQQIRAVVKLRAGARPPRDSELREFLRQRIAGYKVPKGYLFLDSFPETDSGKTVRQKVKEMAERRSETPSARGRD